MIQSKRGAGLIAIAVVFAAIAAAMIGLFLTGRVRGMDDAGFAAAAFLRTEEWTSFFHVFTYLGSAVVLAPLGITIIVYLFVKRWKAEAIALLLVLGGGELLNEMMKAIFARPRPTDFHLIPLPESFSFPSGHAMIAPAFYCMLAFFISRWQEKKGWAVFVQPLMLALVVLLSVSRVYLGVHFLSDIVTGFSLAMCGYCFVRYGYERHLERKRDTVQPVIPTR